MKNWEDMETPKEKADFIRSHLFGIHPDVADYIADELKRTFEASIDVDILQRDRKRLMREIDRLKEVLDDERTEYWL
jgi:hypothetical protein